MSINRIPQFQRHLNKLKIAAFLVEHPKDIFYLSGVEVSVGQLLITPKTARFFLSGIYLEAGTSAAPCPVMEATPGALTEELQKLKIAILGLDGDHTSFNRIATFKRSLRSKKIKIIPLQSPLPELRQIKDQTEQKLLKTAAQLCNRGFLYAKGLLREGVTERTIAKALEIYWLQHGGDKLAFDPIIAFGANSSKPHHHPGPRRLRKGDTVLIDCGVVVDHYASDMTRTLFFGPPDPRLRSIYNSVLRAQKAALDLCAPGTPIVDLDTAARQALAVDGYEQLFSHSLGHGIGLDTHEAPTMRANSSLLDEGMVITIEPGAYLPDVGGVRIEDTVIITADGHKNLTRPTKRLTQLN